MKHPLVLAITGASGVVYARRLLEVLLGNGEQIQLTISPSGSTVIKQELDLDLDLDQFDLSQLVPSAAEMPGNVIYHRHDDYMASIASGSFLTSGMVICPCSGSTLSAVALGASNNLIQRAADIHLKERRKLVLMPRETPLSIAQIDNMRRVAEMGAVMLPAMPGWYHGVESVQDLVDFIVARILDSLGVEHRLMQRWGESRDV